MKKRRAQPGDVYAVPLEDGTFTVCQVVRQWPHGLEVSEFDWIGPQPPVLEGLEAAAPLRPRPDATFEVADPLPPRRFAWLGSSAPLATLSERPPNWLADWEDAGKRVGRLTGEWAPGLADDLRPAEETKRARWERRVAISLDGEPQEVPLGSTELNVYEGEIRQFSEVDTGFRLVVRPATPLDWSQLDRLDGLYTIRFRGRDPGFGDYLRRRRFLAKAAWLDHAESHIDLGMSSIYDLRVGVPPNGLRLDPPDTLEDLTIDAPAGAGPLTVTHFLRGAGLSVWLQGPMQSRISGLDRLRRLHIVLEGSTLDLAQLPACPELEEITAWGKGGSLLGLQALAALPRLRIVRFYEFFDFDPESFPSPETWSELDTIEFHGLKKGAAARLRTRLRGVYRLRISGARSSEWIEATRSNPFHHWVDRDARIAERACKAFVTAERAIRSLGPNPAPADVEPILKRFVNVFNRIATTEFIETVERDEVWAAFQKLAEPVLEPKVVDARFDLWRDF